MPPRGSPLRGGQGGQQTRGGVVRGGADRYESSARKPHSLAHGTEKTTLPSCGTRRDEEEMKEEMEMEGIGKWTAAG